MNERAMAISKFPFDTSMTIEVVKILVSPLIFPPTIIAAPTSAMTLPKPAMIAARMASLTSFIKIQYNWRRVAPKAFTCRINLLLICWKAVLVKPMTIGSDTKIWAMMIAAGVYSQAKSPSGPERHKSIVIHSPATTGGRPMPILIRARRSRLPGNLASPSSIPAGMPINVLISTAVMETLRVRSVISRISRSPERIISIAFFNPSSKSSMGNQAFYQYFNSQGRFAKIVIFRMYV